jgi:hypothetical protein
MGCTRGYSWLRHFQLYYRVYVVFMLANPQMSTDQVFLALQDPDREYDATEVAEITGYPEKYCLKALRSLWKGDLLTRRKAVDRSRLVYRTKQRQLWSMMNASQKVLLRVMDIEA